MPILASLTHTASPAGAKPTNRIKSWLPPPSQTVFTSLEYIFSLKFIALSRFSTMFTAAVIKGPSFERVFCVVSVGSKATGG